MKEVLGRNPLNPLFQRGLSNTPLLRKSSTPPLRKGAGGILTTLLQQLHGLRKHLILLTATACLLFYGSPVTAGTEDISLNDAFEKISVGYHFEYLEDKDNSLTLEDIQGQAYDAQWIAPNSKSQGFGFTTSAYWVRYTVENPTDADIEYFLEQAFPLIDNISIYVPDGSSHRVVEVGDTKPFWERPYENRKFIIPLVLKSKETATYYLRFKTSGSLNILLSLWRPYAFEMDTVKEMQFLMLYYGIFLVMILYNLLVFFFVRRLEYFYYVLTISCFLIFIMGLNGTAFQFLWPGNPAFAHSIGPLVLCLALLFNTLFSVRLLEIRKFTPILYKVIRVLELIILVCLVLCLLMPYRVAFMVSTALTVPFLILGPYLGIRFSLLRHRTGYFYLISWIALFIGGFAHLMMTLAIFPNNFMTYWSLQIGSATLVTLLSIALADRVNTMRLSLAALSGRLEEKVEKRTQELEQANDTLVAARNAIWGEMQLAKKIQTALIPTEPSIEGYDISAYMAPADEVGGDYYDVINVADKDWIIIGDVSGHGVSAGLIMMMVQTSIHTALHHNPEYEPSKMIEHINKTIAQNMKLLGESKYMTITAFAAHQNGRFMFSGLHQNILVYRQQTKTVDSVETHGMWIGIMDNIDGMLENASLALEEGDTMLVHTDGITEAWKKGTNGDGRNRDNMFGGEKLAEVFGTLGHRAVHEIKQGILDALQPYESDDDITLLVAKRA